MKKETIRLIGAFIGLIGLIVLIHSVGWLGTLGVFICLFGNNIERSNL